MMTDVIKVSKMKDLPKILEDLMEDLEEEVDEALEKAAQESVEMLSHQALREGGTKLGGYEQGFVYAKTSDGYLVANESPHSALLEEGALPHSPELHPLIEYLSRQKGGPTYIDVSDATEDDLSDADVFENNDELEAIRVEAVAICEEIETSGIKPQRLMERSFPKIVELVKSELKDIGLT